MNKEYPHSRLFVFFCLIFICLLLVFALTADILSDLGFWALTATALFSGIGAILTMNGGKR